MRQEQNNIFANIDWVLVLLYFILVVFGWMNIYAATNTGESEQIFDISTKYGKQILWILLSIPLIILILFLNSKFYERFSGVLYLVSLLILAGVLIFGKKINGARSWYSFGNFSIQPSEFVKVFTALAVAKLMSERKYNLKLIKNQLKVFIIIFSPAILIALQPDLGSVLIYFSFFLVLNREGLTRIYLITGTLAITLFLLNVYFETTATMTTCLTIITLFFIYRRYKNPYFLKFNWQYIILTYFVISGYIYSIPYIYDNILSQHHRDRFEVFLRMKIDNDKLGYNTHQSELTLSSGGFRGKGFLQGDRTQGDFVPEQHTDYIFSVVGEEWGFIGSSLVIIVFMMLLFRIIKLSEKTPNKFGRIYGYGVASLFFFHIMVNIGMIMGLFPTVGIPLPFFSYGGSGLWGFTLLLFIFIRLDAHKDNAY